MILSWRKHVADAVLAASLEAFERKRLEAPSGHVVVGALLGVADNQLHVVRAEQRQEIVGFGNDFFEVGGGFGQHVFRFFVEVVKFEGVPSSRVTASFGGSPPFRGRGLVGSLCRGRKVSTITANSSVRSLPMLPS